MSTPSSSGKEVRSPRKSGKMSLAEAKAAAARRRIVPAPVDHLQKSRDSASMKKGRTGLVYHERMTEHRNLWDSTHPERPERFSAVIQRCSQLGLINRCYLIKPRPATMEELQLQHNKEHISKLERICKLEEEDAMEERASLYDSIYFHPSTYELATIAAGSVVELVQSITSGVIQNGMAVVRPPGHHAGSDTYCGYCYFNNVAIAARVALNNKWANKILIVDFDVHHGQATQEMFYGEERVLYISTHRYEEGLFWPNLRESNWNWVGEGRGTDYNVNVPLNKTGMGNNEFLSIWHQLLIPLAYQFSPDLILISAGYDAAVGCPEGRMLVEPACYPHLIHPLMGLAGGRVGLILEGGYCLKSLAEAAALSLRTLLGDPCPIISRTGEVAGELVEVILSHHTILRDKLKLKCVKVAGEGEEAHLPKASYLWQEPVPERYPTRDCHPIQTEEEKVELDRILDRLVLTTDLSMAEYQVGIAYDEGMLGHKVMEGAHPERPQRISSIYALHQEFNLLERCLPIPCRDATPEELLLFHTQEHLSTMKGSSNMSQRDLNKLQERYNSVYLNNYSNRAALLASGGLINLVDAVLEGKIQSGTAFIRPPGHHAEEEGACGFCLYNNVVVAAMHGIREGMRRILILDWDVHHGNGVQHAFYNDDRVLYISLHRYDNGAFFPCSTEANYDHVGEGRGEGYNVNIPWNGAGVGDAEYIAAFVNVVLPICYEFGPELVLVSAGFDAAVGDPLGGCRVTPECYAHMTHMLKSLAGGRLVLALEGGYNLDSISHSMVACTKALLGDPLPTIEIGGVKDRAMESIYQVLRVHSKYWRSLEPYMKRVMEYCPIPGGIYMEELEGRVGRIHLGEAARQLEPELQAAVGGVEGPLEEPSPRPRGGTEQKREEQLEGAVGGTATTISEAYSQMLGEDADGSEALYLVAPLAWCPHFNSLGELPPAGLDVITECEECGGGVENWICLCCFGPHCSRYAAGHMQNHYRETFHHLAISCCDLSVWCYGCDSYVDSEVLRPYKSAAHLSKFGVGLG